MGRKQAQVILAAAIAWPGLAQDYTPTPIPNQLIGSPQTTTPLNGGDDSTRLVELGFSFQYFGQTFTNAYVSTNGFVSFADIGHLCCNGAPIEQAPRNAIYGLWTDLISGGNPYYRTNANEAVFGWYGTQEYGSGLSNTFEIALFPDGKVQWNYGDVNNRWHLVTAGLTGPTMADSIAIFYGQDVNLLDNTSYVALDSPPPPPEPEPPFTPVDAAPTIIESPIAQEQQAEEQIEEQEAEQAIAQAIEEQAEETPTEAVSEEIEVQEEVEAQEVTTSSEEAADERLDPNQLQELTAGPAQMDEQAVSEAVQAVGEEAAAAEAAKLEAGGTSSNATETETARADAPQLMELDDAKVEVSEQQAAQEMSAQQEVAQMDMAASQSSEQLTTNVVNTEQSPVEIAASQKSEFEAPSIAQGSENVAVAEQEQKEIVAEQSQSIEQQVEQQVEQAKEPERLIDAIIAEVVTQPETAKIETLEAPQIEQPTITTETPQTTEPERNDIIANLEGYQDINAAFFNKEAIEDADTFKRERVIAVSVADVAIVAAANIEIAQSVGEQSTTETLPGTSEITIVDGPTFMPPPTTGMGDMTTPVNQAQQLELLGMGGMQSEMASGEPTDIGDVNSGDAETMTQLAAAPVGYGQYTQARIPDAPFYAPRDIYRNRRIPDANMALYRMMSGQDAKWSEMVGEQYD